ncbi:type II toxin-antitoxin system PemK/MazF family toxin [Jiangella alba]|uniref:mRNA interferase MazF n=1 Tax=Jiangella alba TaxID=561176 RepID=A0A1H5PGE1_9ACTN|nr:type II toxin-antitoxin system PemK/MazF family toxin [Jiangella alba]SEF12992.1 mRNA interferase MazF [Jiangella alba]
MSGWPPARGEIWDADIVEAGVLPAVVLSAADLNQRLGDLTVVVITGTPGPAVTHVPLNNPGLTGSQPFYADATYLRPVTKEQFIERRGLCSKDELMRIGSLVRVYLEL